MNIYRMFHQSSMEAQLHADRLERQGAMEVVITEVEIDLWAVTWKQR